MSDNFDKLICSAMTKSMFAVADINGNLHTAHYTGGDFSDHRRRLHVRDALRSAEELLAAIRAADAAFGSEADREVHHAIAEQNNEPVCPYSA